MNEIDKLFEELPAEDKKLVESKSPDVFEKPEEKPEEKVEAKEETTEEVEPKKNRRHRRLEDQLQRERESNIALNERIKTLAEVRNQSQSDELDPDLIRVFGDSDVGKEVARILDKKITERTLQAKEDAIAELEERRTQEAREEKQYEAQIDSQLESIEDEYGTDLTSDSPRARKTRREFLELVQQLSPKDEYGNITDYADFQSTFEIYQKTQEKPNADRQKEIASKSMQRSGNVNVDKESFQSHERWLNEQGIRTRLD